ncbi:MAG: biopolymer transporter ExbD [Candidatus Aureabacteria bacterium]|nr:biopolymer transporter ExbD [Candidatus Auribacterota bacterium]NLW93717.1 biopolymer transporter ExbD [Chlamydiota bacterium]HOE28161.1 biopolymer transporter ExbD [bacterium]
MRLVRKKWTEGDELNLTPLIDVVFNLLVFFLVATSFQRVQRELQVDLPKAKSSEAVSMEIQPIAVTVAKDGTITMGEKPVTVEELPKRLKETLAAAQKPRVFVRGDAQAYHQNIVAVLNACQEAGIYDVSLATEE